MVKYLVVVPARGGSKGIPGKNIYPLCGKPLLCYTLEALSQCKTPLTIAVSTDSARIRDVASMFPNVEIIDRPAELSGDTASTEAALLHALDYMEGQGVRFDRVITAQPTSPFRTDRTVDAFIQAFEAHSDRYDAQLTLSENRCDFWVKLPNGEFRRLYPDAPRRRQEREPLYAEDSCIYITKADALRKTHSVLGSQCAGFLIDSLEAIDINTPEDLLYAEAIFENQKNKKIV